MERSKIALHKWMLAFYLLCSSKKGMSALQLKRHLGISYQSAWFLCHRIREAMRPYTRFVETQQATLADTEAALREAQQVMGELAGRIEGI